MAMMNRQPLRLVFLGLLLLVSIWLVWPETEPSDAPSLATKTESSGDRKQTGLDLPGTGQDNRQRRPRSREPSPEDSAMNRIDRLLTDQTMGDRELAEQLRDIAGDQQIPDHVRAEALGHGVLSQHLSAFATMASDRQLPEEMAEVLLDAVINENRDPALQIRTYRDFLLNHRSAEIREDARESLAFVLEDDSGEADVETLIKMAAARLEELEAERLGELEAESSSE